MTKIRIVCKSPVDNTYRTKGKYPLINGVAPALVDTRVFVIDEDTGQEVELDCVESIEWRVGGTDCAMAVLKCVKVEVDVEAILDEGALPDGYT